MPHAHAYVLQPRLYIAATPMYSSHAYFDMLNSISFKFEK